MSSAAGYSILPCRRYVFAKYHSRLEVLTRSTPLSA
jgi:hypothetical protein